MTDNLDLYKKVIELVSTLIALNSMNDEDKEQMKQIIAGATAIMPPDAIESLRQFVQELLSALETSEG